MHFVRPLVPRRNKTSTYRSSLDGRLAETDSYKNAAISGTTETAWKTAPFYEQKPATEGNGNLNVDSYITHRCKVNYWLTSHFSLAVVRKKRTTGQEMLTQVIVFSLGKRVLLDEPRRRLLRVAAHQH